MRHLAFKRSDIAHGKITSIDTSAAAAMDGVEAVYTGADIAKVLAPMPIGTPFPSPPHHAVAVDTVRYAGEPVAVVVASDRYLARDAADAIVVTYDPLPAVVDPELAMTGKPTVIHADFANNLAVALVPSGTGVAPDFSIDRQHRGRQGVRRRRGRDQPAHGQPPPRAERDGAARRGRALGAGQGDDDHLVVDAEPAHPEDDDRGDERPGPASGARDRAGSRRRLRRQDQHLRRGVRRARWSRRSSACRSSGSRIAPKRSSRPRTGATSSATSTSRRSKDGKVLGLKMRLIADIGAYNMLLTAAIPTLTMLMANGTYDIPAIRTTLTEVFTNKTPTDAYRGAGRPEATYFLERAMDMLARELKMDPAELRRKNFIPPNKFPYQTQMGAVYDSGDYEKALDAALKAANWDGLESRARQGAQGRTARRARARDVRRSLRPRSLVVAADRRLGTRPGHRRARRPHHRDHRRLAARPGQRDDVRADAGRSVRRADRARDDPARRHRHREAGHRHVRQPLAGGRRHGAASRRRQGEDRRWRSSPRRCSRRAKTTSSSRTA